MPKRCRFSGADSWSKGHRAFRGSKICLVTMTAAQLWWFRCWSNVPPGKTKRILIMTLLAWRHISSYRNATSCCFLGIMKVPVTSVHYSYVDTAEVCTQQMCWAYISSNAGSKGGAEINQRTLRSQFGVWTLKGGPSQIMMVFVKRRHHFQSSSSMQ